MTRKKRLENPEYAYPEKKRFIKAAMGYNRHEVDAFLHHLADHHLPTDEIKNKRFSNAAMGYEKQDINFYLKELALYRYNIEHADEIEAKRLENLAKIDLDAPHFSKSFRGYKITEIDEFLKQTHQPEEIDSADFSTQFQGYNKYQVDLFLEAWIQKLKGNL